MVPPIHLVSKVLKYLVNNRTIGTLLVPKWVSAPFWPLLFKKEFTLYESVSEVLEFRDPANIYVHGRNKNSIFGSEKS